MKQPLIVAIDFDDTIAYHDEDYNPTELLPYAKEAINWMYDLGCYIIVWTCRNDELLITAKKFLKEKQIKFHKINENASFYNLPTSRKIYADVYIDNRNIFDFDKIDWLKIKNRIRQIYLEKVIENILGNK